jgi:hypothetical protein
MIFLAIAICLSGCAGMGESPLAQGVFGDRISRESDSTVCLKYLAGSGVISNQVREVEIRKRNLNCSTLVSSRDIEVERRLRRAEAAAAEAELNARRAQDVAIEAERKASRQKWCAQGISAYCR